LFNRKSQTQEEERGKEGKKRKRKLIIIKRTNEKVSRSGLRFQMRTRDMASPESRSSENPTKPPL
jgi:hypothetical protein